MLPSETAPLGAEGVVARGRWGWPFEASRKEPEPVLGEKERPDLGFRDSKPASSSSSIAIVATLWVGGKGVEEVRCSIG